MNAMRESWNGQWHRPAVPVFFAIEAEGHVDAARRCLVALAGAGDAAARLLLNDLVHELHGLKVGAEAAGHGAVYTLGDGLEMLFERMREDGLRFREGMIDLAEGVLCTVASLVRASGPDVDRWGDLVELKGAVRDLEVVGRPA